MDSSIILKYAITSNPTPLFNTPNIAKCFGGNDGDSLDLDEKNLNRNVETILFPGTKIQLLRQIDQSHVWQVRAIEYNYKGPFYADDRFFVQTSDLALERTPILPPASSLIQKLQELPHCRYIWGGNWPQGIDLLAQLYPSKTQLSQKDPLIQDSWKLKGLDCTGLPYYLTNGFTPRNSSSLVDFGEPVNIQGKDVKGILHSLRPLDFIVWNGHLVWVIDRLWSIESRHPFGIIRYKTLDRLHEIITERKPVNDYSQSIENRFVVRRWHPDNN
jgi:hypothetical protein